jgi:hypothetical protein
MMHEVVIYRGEQVHERAESELYSLIT